VLEPGCLIRSCAGSRTGQRGQGMSGSLPSAGVARRSVGHALSNLHANSQCRGLSRRARERLGLGTSLEGASERETQAQGQSDLQAGPILPIINGFNAAGNCQQQDVLARKRVSHVRRHPTRSERRAEKAAVKAGSRRPHPRGHARGPPALLDADVNLNVTEAFMERVTEQGDWPAGAPRVNPSEQIVQIVYQELVKLMGVDTASTFAKDRPSVSCSAVSGQRQTRLRQTGPQSPSDGPQPVLVAADLSARLPSSSSGYRGGLFTIPVHGRRPGVGPRRGCRIRRSSSIGIARSIM